MFVEFKRGNSCDPFYDQIILCSARLQNYQFRTWVFSVGIFGDVARLFRWDRAGAIVSEAIPYQERGNRDLAEFFFRFDKMNPAQRGFDHTVFNATPEETVAFDKAIKSAVKKGENALLKELLHSVCNKADYPRRRIEIPALDGEDKQVESYIIGRSIANAGSPTGRATRGFVAMSKKSGNLVFLKDSWRPDIPGMMGEGHWFRRLRGAKNISAFVHGSDVRCVELKLPGAKGSDQFQCTLTNVHSKKYGGPETMMGYIHYRTVQCEFYIPLHMFEDSKHLVRIMLDIAIGTSWLSSA